MTVDPPSPLERGAPEPAGEEGAGQRFWGVSVQTVSLPKLDTYLESVSDQEGALREAAGFTGRLVLRSQRHPDRFWLVDGWSDRMSLETATVTLRTLSSVAGLVDEPRVVNTAELPVGTRQERPAAGAGADGESALPFYMIAENWIRRVATDQYMEFQERFTRDLENEPGYGRRLLLRDLREEEHYLVLDEWESEQLAFEAFERRQQTLSQADMQRFLGFMAKRGEPDFALGIHGQPGGS